MKIKLTVRDRSTDEIGTITEWFSAGIKVDFGPSGISGRRIILFTPAAAVRDLRPISTDRKKGSP